jgi:hypothetical protein
MPTDIPTTFSRDEMLGYHGYRVAEQIEQCVTGAVASPTAARKLCEEMQRKNLVKTERQRETLAAAQHIIISALEAGGKTMLQFSPDLFNDFATAFEDGDEESDR